MSSTPADHRTVSTRTLRIAICGSPGSGRRTLLAALGARAGQTEVVHRERHEIGSFARDLLSGPPVGCAVVIVDAVVGFTSDTHRDVRLLAALGVRNVAVVVNKMDLVGFSEERFTELATEFRGFAAGTQLRPATCLPISALHGDNVWESSPRLAFAGAATLFEYLDALRPGANPPARGGADEADGFQVTVAWAGAQPLLRGRAYDVRIGDETVKGTIAPIKYRLDLDSGEHIAAVQLAAGEVGCCVVELSRRVPFAPYVEDPSLGTVSVVGESGETLGVGTVEFALRRSRNVLWQEVAVDKRTRSQALGQRPVVVWLTGLSGAGKSTIANLVESQLHCRGHHTYLLDGDNVRHGLNADLGFAPADRVENIRRVGEVARLMVDAGLIVLVSFISPFRAERRMARALVAADEFIEVFIDTPLEVAEQRDPKGLYRKARSGQLTNFTGIDSPYEPPENAELRIDTTTCTAEEAAQQIVEALERRGCLSADAGSDRLSPAAGPPR
jgi:adenylyl-sulfate kinase